MFIRIQGEHADHWVMLIFTVFCAILTVYTVQARPSPLVHCIRSPWPSASFGNGSLLTRSWAHRLVAIALLAAVAIVGHAPRARLAFRMRSSRPRPMYDVQKLTGKAQMNLSTATTGADRPLDWKDS